MSFSKKFRKFWVIYSAEEKRIIQEQCNDIIKMAKETFDSECRITEEKNKVCPICGGSKIIEKILDFSGRSSFPEIVFETLPIKHCSECGNQWKEFKPLFKNEREVIRYWVTFCKTYGWEKEPLVFKGFYAESILKIAESVNCEDGLLVSTLQLYFDSIFDKKTI